jgi:hypothetical protein
MEPKMMFRSLILVGLLTTGCTVDTFASPSDSGDGGTQNDAHIRADSTWLSEPVLPPCVSTSQHEKTHASQMG